MGIQDMTPRLIDPRVIFTDEFQQELKDSCPIEPVFPNFAQGFAFRIDPVDYRFDPDGSVLIPIDLACSEWSYKSVLLHTSGRNILEVTVNSHGQILLESQYIKLEELTAVLVSAYLNLGKSANYPDHPNDVLIDIHWHPEVSDSSLARILLAIREAYIVSLGSYHVGDLNGISVDSSKKLICQLSKEITAGKRYFPFTLRYEFHRPPPPPPPPPAEKVSS